jgi:hypothetical protein
VLHRSIETRSQWLAETWLSELKVNRGDIELEGQEAGEAGAPCAGWGDRCAFRRVQDVGRSRLGAEVALESPRGSG